jgi:hypothetical protein
MRLIMGLIALYITKFYASATKAIKNLKNGVNKKVEKNKSYLLNLKAMFYQNQNQNYNESHQRVIDFKFIKNLPRGRCLVYLKIKFNLLMSATASMSATAQAINFLG